MTKEELLQKLNTSDWFRSKENGELNFSRKIVNTKEDFLNMLKQRAVQVKFKKEADKVESEAE